MLNALATTGIALFAGADAVSAARLGGSMLFLQASIGAVNDVIDAPLDRVGKPAKPIPAGAISGPAARRCAFLTGVTGIALAWPSGFATLAVAGLGVGLGYLYDVRLSRTAFSWLPLSVALPLLPIFAWVGATGAAPPGLLALLPAGVLAGAALMTGNGLVDLERDAIAGKSTIAVRIGRETAWRRHAAAFAGAVALAFALAPAATGAAGPGAGAAGSIVDGFVAGLAVLRQVGVPLGAALVALGAVLLRADSPSLRERGWELEAVGTAVLGVSWLAGAAAVARAAEGL